MFFNCRIITRGTLVDKNLLQGHNAQICQRWWKCLKDYTTQQYVQIFMVQYFTYSYVLKLHLNREKKLKHLKVHSKDISKQTWNPMQYCLEPLGAGPGRRLKQNVFV